MFNCQERRAFEERTEALARVHASLCFSPPVLIRRVEEEVERHDMRERMNEGRERYRKSKQTSNRNETKAPSVCKHQLEILRSFRLVSSERVRNESVLPVLDLEDSVLDGAVDLKKVERGKRSELWKNDDEEERERNER